MAGSEAQFIALELERVSDKIKTVFDRDDTFYGMLEKKNVEVISGRDMRIPLELRPGGKFGYWDPNGGALGRGSAPTYDKAVINSFHFKYGVEMTTKSLWATDDKRKALRNAFLDTMAKSMDEFKRNVESQCMTDGTAILGTVSVVAVNNPVGFDTITLTDAYGAKLLRFDQNINVFNSTLTVCRTLAGGEVTITGLDLVNKQIQIPTGSVPGLAAGDLIGTSGVQSTPPVGLYGVNYHQSDASSGVWLGMNRATTPEIRASRTTGNNAALSLTLPRLAVNKIGDRIGLQTRKNKLVAWMHPCQAQAYEELGQNVIRINKEKKDEGLDLYFGDDKTMAGMTIKESYAWNKTRIDPIDLDNWGRAELHPAGYYTNPADGQKVWPGRAPDGGITASWLFYLVASFNIFVVQPAGMSYIDQLAIPAGY